MQIFVFPEVNYWFIFFIHLIFYVLFTPWASLVAQMIKNLPTMWETGIQSLGREDPQEKGMATHSSILAWKIPWTAEPGRLQSMELQRVRHNWATNTHTWTTSPPVLESDKTEKLIPTKSHTSGKHACLILLFVFPVETSCLELPPICSWTGWLFGYGIAVLPRVPFNFSENVFVFFCAIYIVSWVPCPSLSRFIFLLKWSTPSKSFLRKDACGVQFLVLKNVTYFQTSLFCPLFDSLRR